MNISSGWIDPAGERRHIHQPAGAEDKGPLLSGQVVGVPAAVDERYAPAGALLHPTVAEGKEPHDRDEGRRGVDGKLAGQR